MKVLLIFVLVILLMTSVSVSANSHYRVKLSTELVDFLDYGAKLHEPEPILYGSLNFRYLWSHSIEHWAFDFQLVSELNYAPDQRRNLWLHSVPQPAVQDRLFWSITDGSNHSVAALIDRAQLTFKNESFRVSFGRFPNSWGRGLVFHPLDVFNAFSPTLVDREFKRGNDSILVDYVHSSGSELQILTTVRKRLFEIYRPSSTFAVKYFLPLGNGEFETVGAIHYGDEIFSISTTVPMMDFVFRTDVVHTCLHEGDCHLSGIANIDYTLSFLGKPMYIFGEYFYNGLGVHDLSSGYGALSKAHTRRLGRGDLFTLGRNLLAFGTHIAWHPLWNQTCTVLINVNDTSVLLQSFVSYSPTDHASFNVGVRLPYGDTNEEFGELMVDENFGVGGVPGIFAEFIYHR